MHSPRPRPIPKPRPRPRPLGSSSFPPTPPPSHPRLVQPDSGISIHRLEPQIRSSSDIAGPRPPDPEPRTQSLDLVLDHNGRIASHWHLYGAHPPIHSTVLFPLVFLLHWMPISISYHYSIHFACPHPPCYRMLTVILSFSATRPTPSARTARNPNVNVWATIPYSNNSNIPPTYNQLRTTRVPPLLSPSPHQRHLTDPPCPPLPHRAVLHRMQICRPFYLAHPRPQQAIPVQYLPDTFR